MIRPRRLVHRGTVDAAGFLVDRDVARRALAAWVPGATIAPCDGAFLLRLPRPARVPVDVSPGAPLTDGGGVLLSAPLDRDELDALAPPRGSVVRVAGGVARVVTPQAPIDPSSWLDVSSFALEVVAPLGAPPPAPKAVVVVRPDVREILGAVVPAPSTDLAALKAQLVAAESAARADAAGPASAVVRRRLVDQPTLKARATGWLSKAVGWLASLLPTSPVAAGGPAGGNQKPPARPPGATGSEPPARPPGATGAEGGLVSVAALAPPSPGGWLSGLRAALEGLAASLAQSTGLSRLAESRHVEYLDRMVDLFGKGDLDQALRHAIPLSSDPAVDRPPPAWRAPSARDQLKIGPGGGATSSVPIGETMFDRLRRMYREAAEKLVAEGRAEEAAFVYAELLGDVHAAIAVLEKHEKWRLAAEIAEARRMPPALIVRQWVLAGDAERAAAIARRTGTWADAVVQVQRTHPVLADDLRLTWAKQLAASGDLAPAIEALTPMSSPPKVLLARWLDDALDAGGPLAARYAARRVDGDPEAAAKVLERVRPLLAVDGPEGARLREALLDGIVRASAGPGVGWLARTVLREVLVDGPVPKDLGPVLARAHDPALAADLAGVALKPAEDPLEGTWPVQVGFGPADAGTLAPTDVARLADGRWLVALGEAGVELRAPDGRRLRRWDEPAHRLVVAHHGLRAILVARRGEGVRLARLDLATGACRPWTEAAIGAFAPTFDGDVWFVATRDGVAMIDAASEARPSPSGSAEGEFRSLWRVPIGSPATELAVTGTHLTFFVDGAHPERWAYERSGMTLRTREALPPALGGDGNAPRGGEAFVAGPTFLALVAPAVDGLSLRVLGEWTKPLAERGAVAGGLTVDAGARWLAATVLWSDRAEVHVVQRDQPVTRLVVSLDGVGGPPTLDGPRLAGPVVARFCGDHLVVASSRGHLLAYDLLRGRTDRRIALSA